MVDLLLIELISLGIITVIGIPIVVSFPCTCQSSIGMSNFGKKTPQTQEGSILTRGNSQENQLDAFETVSCDYLVATTNNDQWLKMITRSILMFLQIRCLTECLTDCVTGHCSSIRILGLMTL